MTQCYVIPVFNLPWKLYMSILEAIDPAISKYAEREYSLEPDCANGWKIPLKGFRQIPLRYSYKPVDHLVAEYTKFNDTKQYRVVYLGPRHTSNLKAIRSYCQREYDSVLKESYLYGEDSMTKFTYTRSKEKDIAIGLDQLNTRIFRGMNPTMFGDEELIFDSDFECGNLDMAMAISKVEYDLFMRVDSNTRGHTSWYFFKVKNTRKNNRVRFNLCNFHKTSTLYKKGMKPFVFSRIEGSGWAQASVGTTYEPKNLRYAESEPPSKQLHCLSFTFEFPHDYDDVYFAYGIPYSYSYLLKFIDSLAEIPVSKHFLKCERKYESVSGLSVPVLTITNPSSEKKKVVLITGRLHPGEPQGSWVLQGFIKYLCSSEGSRLRDVALFKIIPMVNVDGVVLGNFRTSVRGADLNRKFKPSGKTVFKDDQVGWVKNLAFECQKNIHIYLDFHGHSTSKNSFLYGPEYPMNHENYFHARLLAKLISNETQMFRYHSCNFRIPKHKETTARAIMFRENSIPFCFTIETSNHSYHSQEKGEVLFTSGLFQSLGNIIAHKQQQFLILLNEIDTRNKEMRSMRRKRLSEPRASKGHKLGKSRDLEMTNTISVKRRGEQPLEGESVESVLSEVYSSNHCGELKREIEEEKFITPPIDDQQGDSSDCQSQTEDYTQQQLNSFFETGIYHQEITEISPPKSPPKSRKQKRSASFRLPPTEVAPKMSSRHLQEYKFSSKAMIVESKSISIGIHHPHLDKSLNKDPIFKLRELMRNNSNTRTIQRRLLLETSRGATQECNSVQLRNKDDRVSREEQKSQYFIYRHVKCLVFPQIPRPSPPPKSIKGHTRRAEMLRAVDSSLRRELIWKRNCSLNINRQQPS